MITIGSYVQSKKNKWQGRIYRIDASYSVTKLSPDTLRQYGIKHKRSPWCHVLIDGDQAECAPISDLLEIEPVSIQNVYFTRYFG